MKNTILALLIFLIYACSPRPESSKDFMKYISNPDNGLLKEKITEDVRITVKFLPPSYLALREIQNRRSKNLQVLKDSITDLYRESFPFLITISPVVNTPNNDIMYRGLKNFKEYKERSYEMNFKMDELISITSSGKRIHPVLHTMENTYSLENNRKIYVVFAKEEINQMLKTSNELDFEFDDILFDTGINHFLYEKDKIEKAMAL